MDVGLDGSKGQLTLEAVAYLSRQARPWEYHFRWRCSHYNYNLKTVLRQMLLQVYAYRLSFAPKLSPSLYNIQPILKVAPPPDCSLPQFPC